MGWIPDMEATLDTAKGQVSIAENITWHVVDRLQEVALNKDKDRDLKIRVEAVMDISLAKEVEQKVL